MSATATMLELPRPTSSSSDDSFTSLMHAVLDSARSSASLDSAPESSASASTSASNTSDDTSTSVPSLAASGRTASTSSRASSTSASAASSATPSPCPSILRSSASNLTLPSRTGSPSITFAPLPATEPRKRTGHLGVAARSRLLRHRRMLREHGLNPDECPYPYGPGSGIAGGMGGPLMVGEPADHGWGDDGPVEIREAQAGVDADEDEDARAGRARGAGHPRSRATSDPSEGDALVSLGRLVKGAGKTLWRSISMRDVRSKDGSGAKATATSASVPASPAEEGDAPRPPTLATKERCATLPRKTEVHLFDDPEARPPSAEGGVWEEEIDPESLKKLLSKPPSPDGEPNDTTPRTSIEPAESKGTKRISRVEVIAARVR